jgi:hypothetical protein
MYRSIVVSLIVLHASIAAAADVTVNDPSIRLVASLKQLRDRCGVAGAYDACTHFENYRLEATCAADGEQWSMRGTATIAPVMFLRNLQSARHEYDHIADMRESLRNHVTALETARFASQAACFNAATEAIAAFPAAVRKFAAESLALRDPTTRR